MHQRGNRIAWFCSLQTLGTALFIIASSYISTDIGWRWWYGIFAVVTGLTLLLSILFVVETKYDRPLESFCEVFSDIPMLDITDCRVLCLI